MSSLHHLLSAWIRTPHRIWAQLFSINFRGVAHFNLATQYLHIFLTSYKYTRWKQFWDEAIMNEVKIVWFFQCVSFIHIFVKEQSNSQTGTQNWKMFCINKSTSNYFSEFSLNSAQNSSYTDIILWTAVLQCTVCNRQSINVSCPHLVHVHVLGEVSIIKLQFTAFSVNYLFERILLYSLIHHRTGCYMGHCWFI